MHRAFDEADADRAVRVIILTGAGAAFCAGFDQGPTGSRPRHSDPTGKSIAEFIEYWQRRRRQASRNGRICGGWASRSSRRSTAGRWAAASGTSSPPTSPSPRTRRCSRSPRCGTSRTRAFLFTALCGWKAANRWALTGDHFDAQEALAHRHGQRGGAARSADGGDARAGEAHRAGAGAVGAAQQGDRHAGHPGRRASIPALLLEGTLGALAHASHNEFREQLFEVQREQGLKAYLDMRDGPFQPEPMGPRSAKGRQKKASQ